MEAASRSKNARIQNLYNRAKAENNAGRVDSGIEIMLEVVDFAEQQDLRDDPRYLATLHNLSIVARSRPYLGREALILKGLAAAEGADPGSPFVYADLCIEAATYYEEAVEPDDDKATHYWRKGLQQLLNLLPIAPNTICESLEDTHRYNLPESPERLEIFEDYLDAAIGVLEDEDTDFHDAIADVLRNLLARILDLHAEADRAIDLMDRATKSGLRSVDWGDPDYHAVYLGQALFRVEALIQSGRSDQAINYLEVELARPDTRKAQCVGIRGDLLERLAMLVIGQKEDTEKGEQLAREMLSLAAGLGDTRLRARAMLVLLTALGRGGKQNETLETLKDLLEFDWRGEELSPMAFESVHSMSDSLYSAGLYEEVLKCCDWGDRIVARYSRFFDVDNVEIALDRIRTLRRQGDLAAARDATNDLFKNMEEEYLDEEPCYIDALLAKAHCDIDGEQLDEAIESIQDAYEMAHDLLGDDSIGVGRALLSKGRLLLAQGEPGQAREALDEGKQILDSWSAFIATSRDIYRECIAEIG